MPAVLSIPCPQVIRGCDCTNDPISNYSSEAPDHEVFYGQVTQPPTVGTWFAPACFGVCESLVSQELADECAQRAAFECSLDGAPHTGNPVPRGTFPPLRFRSTVQECSADCGDGNTTTVVEPAGTVVSSTQADADARAHGLACKRAAELRVCFVTTSPLTAIHADSFSSIPIVASGGTGDYEFTLTGGSLPAGMSLDAVGLILGTPTGSGTSTFALTVADSGGGTATKTFTLEVLSACNAATDWCANTGTCRLRVKSFNAGDWTYVWNGNLPNKGTNFVFPCGGGYDDGADASLNYISGTQKWQFNILCPDFTNYIAERSDPTGTNALGVYTQLTGAPCNGPASFELEAYVP